MNLLHATVFGYTAWRVYSTAALLLLYAGLRIYWRREAAHANADAELKFTAHANAPKKRSWKTQPPVSLTDTQRMDHLHRHVSLSAGERVDLKELTFGRLPQLSVTFVGVESASGRDLAHIKLDLGGATADCGAFVQQVGDNDFLLPRIGNDEQRCSLHYTCNKGDAVSHLQLKIVKLDTNKQSAAIDVLHVRGRRAA